MMKFFHSDMGGAPALSGSAGALISVLDACLKDGFGVKSVTSLVVSGGVATATVGSGHPGTVNGTVLVAGASNAALNGDQVVTATTSTTVSWATSLADGTYTGSATLKASPLGWNKPFTATNIAAYKPSSVLASGCVLRLDDTGTTTARVVAYESMSDINTGLGQFPLESQFSGGMYWPKSNSADSNARKWAVVGDGQFFALYVSPNNSYQTHGAMFGFGDIVSNRSGDAFGCALFGGTSNVSFNGAFEGSDLGYSHSPGNTPTNGYIARAATGLGSSQLAGKMSAYLSGQSGISNSGVFTFPDPSNNGLFVSPVDVRVGTSIRGRLPGVLHAPQFINDALNTLSFVDGTGSYAGKKLLVLRTGTPGSTSAGPLFIDITGPWR